MQLLRVGEQGVGLRADVFVHQKNPAVSRSFVHKLFEQQRVYISNVPIKPSHLLKEKDKVQVDFDFTQAGQPSPIKLPIIYEDDDCLVIDKPEGVLTHSKGAFNSEGTVGSFIKTYVKGLDAEREGIVHRLDRATSGVLIAAKSKDAQAWLQKQFSTRKIIKRYLAIVPGTLPESEGLIDAPIERNPKHPQTFRVGANGKSAQTQFRVLAASGKYSLLELQPKTGRTHQLRVHLKFLHKPIVGDTVYGGQPAERMFLHAESLTLALPNGKRQTFSSNLPKAFTVFMERTS